MEHERSTSWAEHEFGGAQLGDRRRTERLVWLAEQRGRRPSASLPACCGSGAGVKAAYRFYETVTIRPQAILAPHRRATLARMAEQPVVLLPQDTTQVDYSTHTDTLGLGVLQNKHQRGLLLHTTLAVTPDRVPLGVVDQQIWTRDPSQFGKRHNRKARPTSEKESQKWLDSLAVAAELQAALPGVRLVSIADREGDVYDFMRQAVPTGPAVLVRASWDRAVNHPQGHLWAFLESQPVAGNLTVSVPRQPGQPTRQAHLRVRFAPLTLKPPRTRLKGEHLPSLTLWGVLAREADPPAGEEPIEWLLLSSLPVSNLDEAAERVAWYSCRWLVEIYHKVLKSGCRIEDRQLETAANLKRYLALDGVVAWQVLYLTMLGRQLPDVPATAVLEAHEWQALYCFTQQVATPPRTPPSLQDAVRWIAKLGGFLGRTADGDPGVTTVWRGLQRLHDIAAAWQLFHIDSLIPDQDVGND
jgi:transposase Tn5 family protein/transposase-like protein